MRIRDLFYSLSVFMLCSCSFAEKATLISPIPFTSENIKKYVYEIKIPKSFITLTSKGVINIDGKEKTVFNLPPNGFIENVFYLYTNPMLFLGVTTSIGEYDTSYACLINIDNSENKDVITEKMPIQDAYLLKNGIIIVTTDSVYFYDFPRKKVAWENIYQQNYVYEINKITINEGVMVIYLQIKKDFIQKILINIKTGEMTKGKE
jgi:hypothetical protein